LQLVIRLHGKGLFPQNNIDFSWKKTFIDLKRDSNTKTG